MSQLDINAPHHDSTIRQPFNLSALVGSVAVLFGTRAKDSAPTAMMTEAEKREEKYRIREQGYLSDVNMATRL